LTPAVDAICILANYSEQFSLTDDERERLTALCLEHVAGRVQVVVTTSHYSQKVAAERSRRARAAGAADGHAHAALPWRDDSTRRVRHLRLLSGRRGCYRHPDHDPGRAGKRRQPQRAVPGSPGVRDRQRPIRESRGAGAAAKLRDLVSRAGRALPGPFDGEESITLLPDLDAGATGTMPSALQPDLLRAIVQSYQAGDRARAVALYERSLPLILYENRQCGLRATKALMYEGGIISSERIRPPMPALHPATRAGLLETARRIEPLILHWA
jgi:2-keto-3-deoxy-L-arabinonate dehydratase